MSLAVMRLDAALAPRARMADGGLAPGAAILLGMQDTLRFADLVVVLVPVLCALWLYSLRHVLREMRRPRRLRH